MTAAGRQFFGKYRASVRVNLDPEGLGRLVLEIPDVLGNTLSSWALPCFPVTGRQMGFFGLPPVGAKVWAEFEHGDPDRPIWTGGYWGSPTEVPPLAVAAPPGLQNILLQTTGQHALLISDVPGPTGGIMLKSKTSALVVNDTGIYLTNGKGASITLVGTVVAVNGTALTVT